MQCNNIQDFKKFIKQNSLINKKNINLSKEYNVIFAIWIDIDEQELNDIEYYDALFILKNFKCINKTSKYKNKIKDTIFNLLFLDKNNFYNIVSKLEIDVDILKLVVIMRNFKISFNKLKINEINYLSNYCIPDIEIIKIIKFNFINLNFINNFYFLFKKIISDKFILHKYYLFLTDFIFKFFLFLKNKNIFLEKKYLDFTNILNILILITKNLYYKNIFIKLKNKLLNTSFPKIENKTKNKSYFSKLNNSNNKYCIVLYEMKNKTKSYKAINVIKSSNFFINNKYALSCMQNFTDHKIFSNKIFENYIDLRTSSEIIFAKFALLSKNLNIDKFNYKILHNFNTKNKEDKNYFTSKLFFLLKKLKLLTYGLNSFEVINFIPEINVDSLKEIFKLNENKIIIIMNAILKMCDIFYTYYDIKKGLYSYNLSKFIDFLTNFIDKNNLGIISLYKNLQIKKLWKEINLFYKSIINIWKPLPINSYINIDLFWKI